MATDIESRFVTLCESTLGIKDLRRDESLIAQGASSMRLMRLVARVYEQFEVLVDLNEIMNDVTANTIITLIASGATGEDLEPAARAGRTQFPLDELQLPFWELRQYQPAHVAYNEGVSHRIQGDLDLKLCRRVLVELVASQATLRSAYVEIDGVPVQQVLPLEEVESHLRLEVMDLSGHVDPMGECAAQHRAAYATVFDLAKPPNFRVLVWKIAERDWVVSWVVSHIVTDFWSVQIIRRAAAELYLSMLDRDASTLDKARDVELLSSNAYTPFSRDDEDYWLAKFARPYADISLAPRRRPAIKSYRGEMVECRLRVDLAELEARRAGLAVTMTSLSFAANCLLLSAVGAQDDIVVGVPFLNRQAASAQNAVGMLLNSLPVRVQVDAQASLETHIAHCHGELRAAMRHGAYPAHRLISKLKLPSSLARAPLYEHLFTYYEKDLAGVVSEKAQLRVSELELPRGNCKFDLSFFITREGADLTSKVEYCRDLFAEGEVRGLISLYEMILNAMAHEPGAPASGVIAAVRSEATSLFGRGGARDN